MCIVTEVQFKVHFSKNLEDEQYILIEERVSCLTNQDSARSWMP